MACGRPYGPSSPPTVECHLPNSTPRAISSMVTPDPAAGEGRRRGYRCSCVPIVRRTDSALIGSSSSVIAVSDFRPIRPPCCIRARRRHAAVRHSCMQNVCCNRRTRQQDTADPSHRTWRTCPRSRSVNEGLAPMHDSAVCGRVSRRDMPASNGSAMMLRYVTHSWPTSSGLRYLGKLRSCLL
jgi:hypothetical protein